MDRKLIALAASFLVALGAGIDTVVQKATEGHPRARHAVYAVENEATRLVRAGLVAATGSCGVERWDEKVLSTRDPVSAAILAEAPQRTNVPALVGLPVPGGQPPTSHRVFGPEQLDYKLAGTRVVAYKLEADSDIHLKLENAQDFANNAASPRTMIGEIPDPGCVSNPAAASVIAEARDAFNRAVAPNEPTGYYQATSLRVTITGPALFDWPHGQNGLAPNAIEIHPILSFHVW